jgi:glutamate formiminotransferase
MYCPLFQLKVYPLTTAPCWPIAQESVIASELAIPVFFYERAAKQKNRVNLEDVRQGALELLREEIASKSDRAPDVVRYAYTKRQEQSQLVRGHF